MINRIHNTRQILKEKGLDALLISSPYNIRYLTGFDGFSTDEREGFTLLTKSQLYIIADPRLSEAARKNAQVIEFGAGKKLLPQLQEILDTEKVKTLGFEENLTYSEYMRFKKLKVKLKMTEDVVEDAREVKDIEEMKSLQKACKLTDECFEFVLKKVKLGVTELGLAWEMEKYIKENGGELAFPTIVAFGENSATPHHKSGNTKLATNTIILLDFGAKVDGYCADMTRTLFYGKADEKFEKMYETVRTSQQLPFDILRGETEKSKSSRTRSNNITPHQIDKVAREHIISLGFPSIPHSVGHGVGLQVHELPHVSPGFDDEIFPNTPFTIEPGIYINGYGGVRIEDTVFYDGKKIISLTKSPKELIEL